MTNIDDRNAPARGNRPYWLLFVLALFVFGQTLGVAHWHNGADITDAQCALCALSSATGAAVVATPWQPLSISCAAIVFCCLVESVRHRAQRFHDSRGPPAFPSCNV